MNNQEYKEYKEEFTINLIPSKKNEELHDIANNKLLPLVGKLPSFFKYRYLGENQELNIRTINEIKEQYVFLCSPMKFDDVYDSKCYIDQNVPAKGIVNSYLTAEYIKENGDDFFGIKDYGSKQVDMYNNIFSEVNTKIDKELRVACFTQKNNNIPMWYYYANEHRGICIEYDLTNVDFTKPEIVFLPVVYPRVKETNEFYDLFFHDNNFKILATRNSLIKNNDWKFEKEWRMIKFVENTDEGIKIPIKIKAVYFGLNCDEKFIDEVKEIIKNYALDIEIYKMNNTYTGLKPVSITNY